MRGRKKGARSRPRTKTPDRPYTRGCALAQRALLGQAALVMPEPDWRFPFAGPRVVGRSISVLIMLLRTATMTMDKRRAGNLPFVALTRGAVAMLSALKRNFPSLFYRYLLTR